MNGHIRKRHKPDCPARRKNGTPAASSGSSQRGRARCTCDGKWQVRMRDKLTGETSKTFGTQQAAKDWLATQRANKLQGTYIDPRKSEQPFAAVVEEWRQSWDARLSPTTARRYSGILNAYLLPEFGDVPLAAIDHGVVQRYVDRLAAQRDPDDPEQPLHAPGTIRSIYAVLRTALAKAVRMGLIRTNPCTNIDLPKARREEMLFLTAEQVRLLAEAIDPQYRVLVYTAAWTGLRAGELAGLRWGDVDLIRGVLHVRRSVRDVNGKLVIGDLKTANSRRTVSLPAFLVAMLREHLTSEATGGTGPDDYVFVMKGGGPLRMGLVYGRYFRRAVAGWTDGRGKHHPGALPAELHALRFHDLRHTCVALSVAAGAHPKLISARLGHSSITVTLDRYGHLFGSLEESLAAALDAAFVSSAESESEAGESNVLPLRG